MTTATVFVGPTRRSREQNSAAGVIESGRNKKAMKEKRDGAIASDEKGTPERMLVNKN